MNKHTKQLEEVNRGLSKRLKAISKASVNNHNGMLFWKKRAQELEAHLLAINYIGQRVIKK